MKNKIQILLREELIKKHSEQELLNEGWKDIVSGALMFLSVVGGNFGEHKPNSQILNLNNQEKKEVVDEYKDEYQTLVKSLEKSQTLEFKTIVNQVKDTIFMALNHKNTPNKENIIQKINKTVFVEADPRVIDSISSGAAGFFTEYNGNAYIFIGKNVDELQIRDIIIHEIMHNIDLGIDGGMESSDNAFINKSKTNKFPKLTPSKDFSNDQKGLLKYLDDVESIIRNIDTLSIEVEKITGINYSMNKNYVDWLSLPQEHYAELHTMKNDLVKMGIMSSFKDDITSDQINFLLGGSNESKVKFKEFIKKHGQRNWMAMLPLIRKDKITNLVNYLNKF